MDEFIPVSVRATYEAVFQDPPPGDLDWKSVRALLSAISSSSAAPHGMIRLVRRGRSLMLHGERHRGVLTEENVRDVRRYLEGPSTPGAGASSAGAHFVVVVGEREGRIYRIGPGPDGRPVASPHDPQGAGRNLCYTIDDPKAPADTGREGFCEAVARALRGAAGVTVLAGGRAAEPGAKRLADYLHSPRSMLAAPVKRASGGPNPTPEQAAARAQAAWE